MRITPCSLRYRRGDPGGEAHEGDRQAGDQVPQRTDQVGADLVQDRGDARLHVDEERFQLLQDLHEADPAVAVIQGGQGADQADHAGSRLDAEQGDQNAEGGVKRQHHSHSYPPRQVVLHGSQRERALRQMIIKIIITEQKRACQRRTVQIQLRMYGAVDQPPTIRRTAP